jgi:hypothetical protein
VDFILKHVQLYCDNMSDRMMYRLTVYLRPQSLSLVRVVFPVQLSSSHWNGLSTIGFPWQVNPAVAINTNIEDADSWVRTPFGIN